MSILITGSHGFLGKALVKYLSAVGYDDIVPLGSKPETTRDLRVRKNVDMLLQRFKPAVIIHLAARVGGIGANMKHPGKFFYDNILMGVNLIDAAREYNVDKFVQVGTVCSYPKHTPVPFKEEELWNGYPEETNAPYGIAKKALLVMLQAYRKEYGLNGIYLIPVNLYGPGDNFDPENSHVIPALIRKIVTAHKLSLPKVEIWGTGSASREFLYVDECARAIELAMANYDEAEPVNVGAGKEISIAELANTIKRLVGYNGELVWDSSKPDGQPRRCLDTSKASQLFDFENKVDFEDGLRKTIDYFQEEYGEQINVDAVTNS